MTIGSNKRGETIGELFKSWFRDNDEPLEKKIILAHYRVKSSIGRISSYLDKLERRDRELFQQIVEALMQKDERKAKMYAREVAELRKIAKQLITAKYALEQVALSLETFLLFGSATKEISTIIGIMNEAVKITKSVGIDTWVDLQAAIRELQAAIDVGVAGYDLELDVGLDSEAKKVFEEARIAAEQAIKEKYAELPRVIASEEVKTEETV